MGAILSLIVSTLSLLSTPAVPPRESFPPPVVALGYNDGWTGDRNICLVLYRDNYVVWEENDQFWFAKLSSAEARRLGTRIHKMFRRLRGECDDCADAWLLRWEAGQKRQSEKSSVGTSICERLHFPGAQKWPGTEAIPHYEDL